MSEDILMAKRKKRQLERAWRLSKSKIFCRALTRQVHHFNRILSQAKSDWYTSLIEKNKDKPRNLWQSINRILHRSQSSPLPDFSDCTSLSNRFGTYLVLIVMDVVLSAIQRPQFGIKFHTLFVLHHQ